MPVQYIPHRTPLLYRKTQVCKGIPFLFLLQNIDCGYSLEQPPQGGSNVYPKSMFWAKINKKTYKNFSVDFLFIFTAAKSLYIALACFHNVCFRLNDLRMKTYEPHHEKTGILPVRKQRRRSALSNCEADQRLCFRYSDSTIPLLLIAKISSL